MATSEDLRLGLEAAIDAGDEELARAIHAKMQGGAPAEVAPPAMYQRGQPAWAPQDYLASPPPVQPGNASSAVGEAQDAAMAANRRSGADPLKYFLNVGTFGQRPRLRAAFAALAPDLLKSEEDKIAASGGGYDSALSYFRKDQDQGAGALPLAVKLPAALAGATLTGPAAFRALGTPITTATGATGLGKAATGVADLALQNAGLSAAAAGKGQAGEAAVEGATSPWNALGVVPGLAEAVRPLGATLRRWADQRAYKAVGETPELNDAVRSFDPSGRGGVDEGKAAVGEYLRDSPILKRGQTPSQVDTSTKQWRDYLGAKLEQFKQRADAAKVHPDWESLKADLEGTLAELDSPSIRVAHGSEPAADFRSLLKRLESEYAPVAPQPIATVRGSGAQVTSTPKGTPGPGQERVHQPIGPGAAQNVNEQGLIPPTKDVYTPITDIPEPSAAPHSMADMEEGLPAARRPEPEAYNERTGVPGDSFPAPKLDWIEGYNRRSFTEWERLKSDLQNAIEITRAKYIPTGNVKATHPAAEALRKLAGKVRAYDDAAIGAQMGPEAAAEYAALKREFGITTTAAEAAQRGATRVRNDRDALRETGYAARRLPGALSAAGVAAGFSHGPIGVAAGGLTGYGAEQAARWAQEAHPTMTRAYDAAGKAVGKANVDPEVTSLINYLRRVVP